MCSNMWVYIALAVLGVYALLKERQEFGCGKNVADVWTPCDNTKNIPKLPPNPSKQELYNNIANTTEYATSRVTWRGDLMISLITIVVVWFFLFKRAPREWELLAGTFVIFVMLTLRQDFYQYHYLRPVASSINSSAFKMMNM